MTEIVRKSLITKQDLEAYLKSCAITFSPDLSIDPVHNIISKQADTCNGRLQGFHLAHIVTGQTGTSFTATCLSNKVFSIATTATSFSAQVRGVPKILKDFIINVPCRITWNVTLPDLNLT